MSNIFKHNSTKLQLYQSHCLAYNPCSKKYIFHNFLASCAPHPSIVKNYTVFSFRLLWVLNENIQGSDTYEVVNEVLVGSLCLCSKKVFEKRIKRNFFYHDLSN